MASSHERRADVADQDGFKTSVLGIAIAVFLGLMIRAVLNSEYIEEQLRAAADRIHVKLKIEFSSARVSLSNRGVPELAAIVEGIRFKSTETCWGLPEGQIDELRLPLNLWHMLKGQVEVTEVKIGSISVKVGDQWKSCQTPPAEKPPANANKTSNQLPTVDSQDQTTNKIVAEAGQQAVKPTVSQAENSADKAETQSSAESLTSSAQPRGPIRRLLIDSLKVEYQGLPDLPIDFESLSLSRKSETDLQMNLVGLLNLGGSSLSGDYVSQAQFETDLGGDEHKLKLNGTWREGRYQIDGLYNEAQKTLALGGKVDNLPLSQILSLLKQFNLVDGEYDSRQLWLSLDFTTDGPKPTHVDMPFRIKNFGLEGDLGEIRGENLQVSVGSKTELSPGELRIRGLKPEKVLTLVGKNSKSPSLGSLGVMNGTILYKNFDQWSFVGESSGLELVFSNRGERKLQTLSVISGKADFNAGNWLLLVDRVRPLEGLFLGSLRMEGYRNKPNVDFELILEELSLSPDVQALMSGGGALGRWSGEMRGAFTNGLTSSLKGNLTGQALLIEGLQVDRLKAGFSQASDRITAEIRGQGVEILGNTPLRRFFDGLFKPVSYPETEPLRTDAFSAQFQISTLSDLLTWKFRPTVFSGLNVSSEGGWDQIYSLKGEVSAVYKGRSVGWKIEGDREKPVFNQK